MSISSIIKSAEDLFTKATPKKPTAFADRRDPINGFIDSNFYETKQENWFRAMPYGFKFRDRNGKQHVFMLPISPQNLTITTHYATNVITTLFGTVEEHSEQRYFDILIEGTTGMAPRFTRAMGLDEVSNIKSKVAPGRSSYADAEGARLSIAADVAGGFFSKTIGLVNQAIGKAQDLIDGKENLNVSGVKTDKNTGYAAFHSLYKFLLTYKADAAGIDVVNKKPIVTPRKREKGKSAHPLAFLNYKDNNEYDVAVQRFSLRRDTSNPMLYNYSIVLRAYNLRNIGDAKIGGLPTRESTLGLNGIDSSSLLGEITEGATNVRQIFGALGGGLDIFGR